MSANVAYALTTEQRIKDRLAITVSDLDTVIKRMMYGATDFIQKLCSTPSFKRATYTDQIYNGSDTNSDSRKNMLILKCAPVVSVSAVKYNAGSQASPSWVTMSSQDYTLDIETGILHFSGTIPAGIANISVTYVAGYLVDFTDEFNNVVHTLPYELSDLCDRLVTKALKRRESEGKSTETFNGSTITWGDLLEDADLTMIANYKRAFTA